MTQAAKCEIDGPVKITIKGPHGSGKSRLASAISEHLERLGIETVSYDSEVPAKERRWRKPYGKSDAKVMIVEKRKSL